MDKEVSGRVAPLQDRHMWRQLLARLHPDTGGDHKLFLFACALKESLCEERRVRTAGHEGPGPEHSFLTWRDTMIFWASCNREGLRKPGPPPHYRSHSR
jgi:hypothetical protein